VDFLGILVYVACMVEQKDPQYGVTVPLRLTPKAAELVRGIKARTGGIAQNQFLQQLLAWFADHDDAWMTATLVEMRKHWSPTVNGRNYDNKPKAKGRKRKPGLDNI
jgi:hypothetical protein